MLGTVVLASTFLGLMLALPTAGALVGLDTALVSELAPWAAVAVCSLVASVVAFGILKARADVAFPSLIGFAGYWGVGLTLIAPARRAARVGRGGNLGRTGSRDDGQRRRPLDLPATPRRRTHRCRPRPVNAVTAAPIHTLLHTVAATAILEGSLPQATAARHDFGRISTHHERKTKT